jgi:hypothetical protein
MIEPIEIDVRQFIAVIDLALQWAWATVLVLGVSAGIYAMVSLLLLSSDEGE